MGRYFANTEFFGRYTEGDGQTFMEGWIKDMRDRIRAAVSGSSIKVSDIMTWSGSHTSTLDQMFFIRAGSFEFGFCTYGSLTSTSTAYRQLSAHFANGVHTDIEPFLGVDDNESSISSSYSSANTAVLHNRGEISFGIPWSDPVEMTLSGGDYTTVDMPWTNFLGFFAASSVQTKGQLVPLSRFGTGTSTSGICQVGFLISDTPGNEFLGIYASDQQKPMPGSVFLVGDILEPLSGDTDSIGWASFSFSTTGGNSPVSFSTSSSKFVHGIDNLGAPHVFEVTVDENFTASNSVVGGEHRWSPVEIQNTTYTKGWIKTDLIRNTGIARLSRHGQIFDGPDGPFIQLQDRLCFPYVTGKTHWPYPLSFDGA